MINEPCYEARISIPALQYKIFGFVQEQMPILEETVIKEVVSEMFNEKSGVLKGYIGNVVEVEIRKQVGYIARDVLDTPGFRSRIEKLILKRLNAAIKRCNDDG